MRQTDLRWVVSCRSTMIMVECPKGTVQGAGGVMSSRRWLSCWRLTTDDICSTSNGIGNTWSKWCDSWSNRAVYRNFIVNVQFSRSGYWIIHYCIGTSVFGQKGAYGMTHKWQIYKNVTNMNKTQLMRSARHKCNCWLQHMDKFYIVTWRGGGPS